MRSLHPNPDNWTKWWWYLTMFLDAAMWNLHDLARPLLGP
jgi:hypothetical protein